MFKAAKSPFLVPFDGSFSLSQTSTTPPEKEAGKKENQRKLAKAVEKLDELQQVLYADNRYALLLIFQAVDAAGKDSTIRAVLRGVNPAGCQVYSFKAPTSEELEHDFLWRTHRCLPERGRIGVFNRSYYEEVLVVRVHPEILDGQRLPYRAKNNGIWKERFESIANHELHLARNGMVVLKFWLNVSRDEQKRRFMSRIDEPDKNWKFAEGDVREREHWDAYQTAFAETLQATSRPWAPWYAVPADDKPFLRRAVAEIIIDNLKRLKMSYPVVDASRREELQRLRSLLAAD